MSEYNLTNGSHWSTAMELNYLDNLVSGKWMSPATQLADKRELLKNYISWAKHRIRHKTFGTIDGEQCIIRAEILLGAMK